jgi:hypothetical protein
MNAKHTRTVSKILATFALVAGLSVAGTAEANPPLIRVQVGLPMPAPRHEVVLPRPDRSPNWHWVAGDWQMSRGAWVWQPGHWVKSVPNRTYVNGYWKANGGYRVYIPGHWR